MPAAPPRDPDAGAAERRALRARYEAATAHLDPPFALVDVDAFDTNAAALRALAADKPLRVASKSVRCRHLLRRVLGSAGWAGVMAYSLAEALWLVETGITDDVLIGYPTADRASLATLATDPAAAAAVTLMIDDTAQLDLIDAVAPPGRRETLRVCIDLDASWRPVRGVHVGVRRSPVHSPASAAALAGAIAARPGFRLVGLMSYEAHIAGLGDDPPGRRVRAALIRAVQARSYAELLARRAAAVTAVRARADLEFVNGGGTGSVAATAADPAVTEVTAGSGLYGPTLFDAYRAWRPTPAAFFALSVVRKPTPRTATVSGGGWVASGEAHPSRLPTPWLPGGLRLVPAEGAGEVQTPLVGPGAADLTVGDRVWFRHAKAGELCEHVDALHLVSGDSIVEAAATYRGEAKAFLG
ncbi:amino acid deaminase/aldolase [Planosporangium thailandense]|uniref:Amino acid deaminase/aldolase n=1 Tax=Planosporangium thailandense TaxID=765197 RepID=A0ABX0XT71_9ACTN|nr:amino acid deaminase/aldolase [Planosporangium thailandense]